MLLFAFNSSCLSVSMSILIGMLYRIPVLWFFFVGLGCEGLVEARVPLLLVVFLGLLWTSEAVFFE